MLPVLGQRLARGLYTGGPDPGEHEQQLIFGSRQFKAN
jgi:hypothetical protein